MRTTLLTLGTLAIAAPLYAQCQNGRCYTGQCPTSGVVIQTFGQSTAVAAVGVAADDRTAWEKMPKDERAAYNAAMERVKKGETVILCCGPYGSLNSVTIPHGVPGLATGFHKCYRLDGVPKAEPIRADDPAVVWQLHSGPQSLTGGETRVPLAPSKK